MGLGPWAMGVFLVLLAVILIGVFAGAWVRDRRRSREQGDDASRQDTGRQDTGRQDTGRQRTGRRR